VYTSHYTVINRAVKSISMRWARLAVRIGDIRNAYKYSDRKSRGIRLVGKPRLRWERNLKMGLKGKR